MGKVALSNVQLDHLAYNHPDLGKFYDGTRACDRLPSTNHHEGIYIVNTDPHDKPGTHWIAIWADGEHCEMMDSFALSLKMYPDSEPLQQWIERHYNRCTMNSQSLQALSINSCGDYALFYLIDKSRGYSMQDFISRFKPHRFVWNDHHVGQMLKSYIQKYQLWSGVCNKPHHQCNKKQS